VPPLISVVQKHRSADHDQHDGDGTDNHVPLPPPLGISPPPSLEMKPPFREGRAYLKPPIPEVHFHHIGFGGIPQPFKILCQGIGSGPGTTPFTERSE